MGITILVLNSPATAQHPADVTNRRDAIFC
jgi:hypothetical protein